MEEEEFNNFKNNLSLREVFVIETLYGFNGKEKKSKEEFANMFGISISYISRLESKIIKKIKMNIERPKYFTL